MVRYSFLVGLFHPRLHAGLSRRLHSLTVVARKSLPSRARQETIGIPFTVTNRHPQSVARSLWSRLS